MSDPRPRRRLVTPTQARVDGSQPLGGRLDRRAFLRGAVRGAGLLVVTTGAGGAVLAACDVAEERGEGPDGEGDGGISTDQLDIRLVLDIENLDPAFLVGTVEDAVMLCVAENLVTFAPDSTDLVNELAEEFESSEDGLNHEFKLKEGIPFHGDYGEVTAEDVKFSFERIASGIEPEIDATFAEDWATLEEVEVTGDYTGVIRLNDPFAPLMRTTIPGHAGMIMSKAAIEDRGEDIATQPIGSGPYEFVEWNRNQFVVLRRFEDWGGAALEYTEEPQWEEIRLHAIEDDSNADVAIETGEVDFGPVSHASVGRFEDDDRFEVVRQETYDYGWIGFNVTHEILSDVNVRRALRWGLDVESMLAAAVEGRTQQAFTLISPEMPLGHWADAPEYPRDVEAARELLEEAGHGDGFEVEMAIIEEPGSRVIAEIAQANLRELDVDVSIRLHEPAELRERLADIGFCYVSFSNAFDPSWATVWFTSQYVGSWNYMSWENEEYDRLNDEAIRELDEDRRHDMYVRMQEIMDEDAVAKWVMYRTHHYVHPPELDPSMLLPRYGKYRAWDHRA